MGREIVESGGFEYFDISMFERPITQSPDYWTYSLICYWNIIMYQTILIITDSWYYSLFTIIVYAVHILTNFLTVFIRNYVKTDQCAGITVPLFGTWKYWFIIFLTFLLVIFLILFGLNF